MAYDKEHWRNPRGTIASRYKDDDIAYATHGGIMLLEALSAINQPVTALRGLIVLDYGCGTGRVARLLSKTCAKVIAYDPVQECIDLVHVECRGMEFPNVKATSRIEEIPLCDIAISQNVIEHLTDDDALIMIKNLQERVARLSYIWYSVRRNTNVLRPWLTDEMLAQDKAGAEAHGGDKIVIRPFNFRN